MFFTFRIDVYELNNKKLEDVFEEIYNFKIFKKTEIDDEALEIKNAITPGHGLKSNLNNKNIFEENIMNEKDESLEEITDSENGDSPIGEKNSKHKKILTKELLNWKTKVNRFLYFCLNGGICDYAFTFKDISNELSKYIEYHKVFIKLMNIIDVDKLSKKKDIDDHADVLFDITTISEKNNIYFNEDSMCGMIKTGTLLKIFNDTLEIVITLFKILLKEKYASNKVVGKNIFIS